MPRQFVGIQYLRGLAAMMVVVFHLEAHLRRMGYHGFWPAGLAGGVDLFFVISGFVMWVTTADREIGPATFWRRRIARIVPLYWLATSAVVAMMLVAPGLLQSSRFDAMHVAASYLFVPWHHPVLHRAWPVLMPGWTLDYEMAFYLVFGAFLLARRSAVRLWGTVGVLVALALVGWVARPQALAAAFYTDDVMLEFAGGIVLGAALRRSGAEMRLPVFTAWMLVAFGIGSILIVPQLTGSPSRFWTMGLGATATVTGMLAIELQGALRPHRLLRLLGDASYSIYLSQQISIAAVAALWRRSGLTATPRDRVAFCFVATIVAALAGIALYWTVERRLVRWFRPQRR